MQDSRLRIIVLGYVVRGPLAGLAWHHLQYVLGLARLGHDVYFFEESGEYPACYDPITNQLSEDPSYGFQFLSSAMAHLDLPQRWAYYDIHTARWLGPCATRALDICSEADLCLNLSGVNRIRPWLRKIPVRALVDTDPAFTQIRHLTSADARQDAALHNAFLSFGENLPTGVSRIPDDGFPWKPTRQPIVLDAWPVIPAPGDCPFTSVLLWEAYPAAVYDGKRYGLKSDSFGQFIDLPARVGPVFELALGGPTRPRRRLSAHGWKLIDPREPTRNLELYQRYIQNSKAEFGIAKHGYVASRSGWFSERSVAYLASGRPVLVQDTGFAEWLPTGEGVLPFRNVDDVVAGIEAIKANYRRHCEAARAVARTYFEATTVLTRLIKEVMNTDGR